MGTGNYFSDCCQESEQAGWAVLSSALYIWQEVQRQARTWRASTAAALGVLQN